MTDELRKALIPIAARMVRMDGGCEKGHKAGQWHMHEEPYHFIGRTLADLTHRFRATSSERPADGSGEVLAMNTDGSPCWCDRGQGHTRECADRREAWIADGRPPFTLRATLDAIEAAVLDLPTYLSHGYVMAHRDQVLAVIQKQKRAERLFAAIPQDATPMIKRVYGLTMAELKHAIDYHDMWHPHSSDAHNCDGMCVSCRAEGNID